MVILSSLFVRLVSASPALESATAPSVEQRNHGPGSSGFSHEFRWAPRSYDHWQAGLHFGLSQPLLLGGFNVAADAHHGRWVFEYSHGMWLDYNRVESVMLTQSEQDASLDLDSPWTTGFGIGYRVLDELYPMIEFKAHHYTASVEDDERRYTTISIGPALAHRLFLIDGLFVNTYVRYWPNVWSSRPHLEFGSGLRHDPVDLGLFANLSVGYALDLN